MKVPTAARGHEALEKERDVEPHAHFSLHDDLGSARMDTAKPKVIPGMPDQKLRQVEQIHKNTRHDTQLIRIKTKKNMPTQNNRKHRGKSKQQRLKPRQNTLSQWTRKEKMLQGFRRSPTKVRERNWQPERPKTLRCIEDTVSNLPTQVGHLTAQIKKEKGTPSGRPIKSTIDPSKLLHTMRRDHTFGQKEQVTGLGTRNRHGGTDMSGRRTIDQGITRHRKRPIQTAPSKKERPIEGWQDPGVIRIRPGKNVKGGSTKMKIKPKWHEGNPARKRGGEPPHPLTEKSPDFKLDIDHRKTTKQRGLDNNRARDYFTLARPEKGESKKGKFF